MNLSEWAAEQISFAKLFRNLSQENPVTLSIEHGGQSFSVLVAYGEPGFGVPFNAVWICAGGNFEGAVLRRVSENPMPPFINEWIELQELEEVFAELPVWRPQEVQTGEIEKFAVGPASTTEAGIFTLTAGNKAVPTSADELSDARDPLEHSHDFEPNRFIKVGDLLIDVGLSDPPNAGDVLVITQVADGFLKGEWVQLAETDILYDGPWPIALVINGPTGPIDEMTQVQFTADIRFEDLTLARVTPTWEVNDPLSAYITEDGIFQAHNVDSATEFFVKAKFEHVETDTSLEAIVSVMVNDVDSSLALTQLEVEGPTVVPKGGAATFLAYATFGGEHRVPVAPDFWELDDTNAGTINKFGVFVANPLAGDIGASITATYSNKGITRTASFAIEVKDNSSHPVSASIIGPSTLDENTSATYQLEVTFDNGRVQQVAVSDWAHSNPLAGSIGRLSGKFSAADLSANQMTTISASYTVAGVTVAASKTVTAIDTTVYPQVIEIFGPDYVVEGRNAEFSAVVTYTDGSAKSLHSGWAVSTDAYGSIDPTTGVFTAISDVASNNDVTVSISTTLNDKTVSSSKTISVNTTADLPATAVIGAPSALKVGESQSLTFTVTTQGGETYRAKPTWSLSNTGIASITPGGLLTAKPLDETAVLTVYASYTASGVTVTAVAYITINDLKVRPLSAVISGVDAVSDSHTSNFTLEVRFSDGATRTVQGFWNSSDTGVGTINNNGTFMPISEGTTLLSATYTAQGVTVSATKEITVL